MAKVCMGVFLNSFVIKKRKHLLIDLCLLCDKPEIIRIMYNINFRGSSWGLPKLQIILRLLHKINQL